MKLAPKHLLLLAALALASRAPAVLAEETAAAAADAATEAADASAGADNDAGQQCAADCPPPTATPEGPEDPKCPSRPHVIRCAAKHLDVNGNGALERSELEDALGQTSWLLRGLLKVLGSVDTIMKKCDADGDGAIDIKHDMAATAETCLATCTKRRAFKFLLFPDCNE